MTTGPPKVRRRWSTEDGEVLLTTRIPSRLRRRLRIHAVERGIPQQDFVCAALQEKLAKSRARSRRGARSR